MVAWREFKMYCGTHGSWRHSATLNTVTWLRRANTARQMSWCWNIDLYHLYNTRPVYSSTQKRWQTLVQLDQYNYQIYRSYCWWVHICRCITTERDCTEEPEVVLGKFYNIYHVIVLSDRSEIMIDFITMNGSIGYIANALMHVVSDRTMLRNILSTKQERVENNDSTCLSLSPFSDNTTIYSSF